MSSFIRKGKLFESDEAKYIEDAVIAIGASDLRPSSNQYALAPHPEHFESIKQSLMAELERQNSQPFPTEGVCRHFPTGLLSTIIEPPFGSGLLAISSKNVYGGKLQSYRSWGIIPQSARSANVVYATRIKPNGKCASTSTLFTEVPPLRGTINVHSQTHGWYAASLKGWKEPYTNDTPHYPDIIRFAWRMMVENWSVLFYLGDAPAIRMAASSDRIAGLFMLRNKAPELSRLQALRHWVRDHQRSLPDGRYCDVTAYLRGKEEFDWFGFRCRVVPPVKYQQQ